MHVLPGNLPSTFTFERQRPKEKVLRKTLRIVNAQNIRNLRMVSNIVTLTISQQHYAGSN